jgi:DNA-binding IclR family transcriptional regulator
MAKFLRRASAIRDHVFDLDHAPVAETPAAEPQATTHTLERALTVLKAFAGDARPLSNGDLVRRTGFSKASISRITATLVALRYLEKAPDGLRFQIGLRGLILGHNYLANSPIRQLARPIMQAFAEQFDVSVALAVGDGLDMLYVEYCKSPRIVTLRLGVGSVLPMELTSIGRAYLWAQPPEIRQRLLFEIFKKAGAKGPAIVARIESAFDDLEKHGHCVAIGEYQRDAFGLSVPLFLGSPPVPMALNCGAVSPEPRDSYLREVLAPNLCKAAAAMRKALANVDSILL